MSNRIIRTVNDLPKVCNNINLPFQSGDDVVLSNMKRGYTRDQYVEKIREIKQEIPGVTLTTDLIVGFPGESRTQFENSVEILKFIKFDKVHAAAYSERSGTVASRNLADTVEQREKKLRLREINDIQQKIQSEKNKKFLGDTLDILVEGERRGRIFGRAKNDKIVYINDDVGKLCSNGKTVKVKINQTSSWSLEGVPSGTG
jgi:tRNA-2-methylthio-N6-dimethylallyladenosine synthase